MSELKYKTSDLYLAAYLKVKGNKYLVEKENFKSFFIFDETLELLESVNEYLTECGSCEPLLYANSIKNLKNLIFNKKD